MAKVVNLSRVRKSRARDEKRAQADANAVKFGRSKGEKRQETKDSRKSKRHLDGHLLKD